MMPSFEFPDGRQNHYNNVSTILNLKKLVIIGFGVAPNSVYFNSKCDNIFLRFSILKEGRELVSKSLDIVAKNTGPFIARVKFWYDHKYEGEKR